MATVEMGTELLIKEIRDMLRYNEDYKVEINLYGLYGTICIEVIKICYPKNEILFIDRGINFNKRLFNIYQFLTDNLKLLPYPKNE